MNRGRVIDEETQEIIFRVYRYFANEASVFKKTENNYFQKVQQRVAQATGVSTKYLYTLLQGRDITNLHRGSGNPQSTNSKDDDDDDEIDSEDEEPDLLLTSNGTIRAEIIEIFDQPLTHSKVILTKRKPEDTEVDQSPGPSKVAKNEKITDRIQEVCTAQSEERSTKIQSEIVDDDGNNRPGSSGLILNNNNTIKGLSIQSKLPTLSPITYIKPDPDYVSLTVPIEFDPAIFQNESSDSDD